MPGERWRFFGVDETNNGKFPVIYAAVFANSPLDAEILPQTAFPKVRRGHRGLSTKLASRDYSFLLLTRAEAEIFGYHRLPGVVAASLVQHEPLEAPLELFFDGEVFGHDPLKHSEYARDMLREVTGLPRDLISVHYGKDLDRRVRIVNLADEVAHWLLKKSIETIRDNPRMKTLIRV